MQTPRLDWSNINNTSGSFGVSSKKSYTLPEGEYLAEISTIEMRQSATSPWEYMRIRFGILLPEEYLERGVFNNYFIGHPDNLTDPKIQELIGVNYNNLNKIFNAVGCPGETDYEELYNKKLFITLKVRAGKPKEPGSTDKWPDSNEVISARPFNPAPHHHDVMPPMKQSSAKQKIVAVDLENDELPF